MLKILNPKCKTKGGHANECKTLLLCKNKNKWWWKLRISAERAVAKVKVLTFYGKGIF